MQNDLRASPDPAMNAQAADEYKAAVEENQYDGEGMVQPGRRRREKGDFKTAEEDYRKALALQPKDADAETGIGHCDDLDQSIGRALPILESAVKDDPTDIVAIIA